MRNAIRGFVGVGLLALAAWVLCADLTQAGQLPTVPGGGEYPRTLNEPEVTVAKVVNCQGKVTYLYPQYPLSWPSDFFSSKAKKLQAEYEKAKAYWDKMSAAGAKPGGALNESVEPVEPIMEFLDTNMKKSKAENLYLKAKDWAVYEIRIGDTVLKHVAYAHSDAFAKALARADYAKLSNARLRSGGEKAGGELPQPTVEKVTEALSCRDANAELRRIVNAEPAATSAGQKQH